MQDYDTWKDLCRKAAQAGHAVGIRKNRTTDAAFDDACQALCAFETVHGLDGTKHPSDFY